MEWYFKYSYRSLNLFLSFLKALYEYKLYRKDNIEHITNPPNTFAEETFFLTSGGPGFC